MKTKTVFITIVLLIILPFVTLSQVVQGECYIDTDPGTGNGISFSASDGSFNDVMESILNNALSIAPAGLHTINIRVKDNNGNWGPVYKTVISVGASLTLPSIQITTGELFWDTDPGTGNGASFIAFDGSFDNAIETAINSSVSTPAIGNHKLCVRAKDNTTWGPVFTTIVKVENLFAAGNISITAGELFWDTDPGAGNGTAFIAFDGSFDNAIETAIKNSTATPAIGNHKLCIRTKDNTTWGPVFTTVVRVENLFVARNINIITGELFWDTDPGNGNGTSLIAFDGNFNDAIEKVFSTPSLGLHTLNVRVQDAANNWGQSFKTVVKIENLFNARAIKITAGELFYDADPGNGNGIPFLAYDGNYSDAIEAVVNNAVASTGLTYGVHKLSVRTMDAAAQWGPAFSTVLKIDSNFVARNIKIAQLEMFYDNDPGLGNGISMLAFDGNFDNAVETGSIYWGFLPDTGFHTFSVRAKDINGSWGPVNKSIIYITPCTSSPVPTVTLGGDSTICVGDSVLLTATGGYSSYTWMKGNTVVGTGPTYFASQAGYYKVWVTDGSGCPGASVFVRVIQTSNNPVIAVSGATTFCDGGSAILDAGSGYVSYLWSTGETTQTITVDTTGNYSVNTNNGFCTRQSPTVITTVNPLPAIPVITANGPIEFCIGDSVLLSSDAATSYSWNTSATSQAITVYASGNYVVTVSNSYGCHSSSLGMNVNVHDPIAVITPGGSVHVCYGDSVALTANTFSQYQWNTGETTQSIYVDSAGNYGVKVTDAIGCKDSTTVNVSKSGAMTSVITVIPATCGQNDGSISVTAGGGIPPYYYYWSTGQTTTGFSGISGNPTQLFTVTITDSYGCSLVDSDSVNCVLSVNSIDVNSGLNVFPSPASNEITVHVNELTKVNALLILNIEGQELVRKVLEANLTKIDISHFSNGIYFIKYENENGIVTQKLIKN